MKNNNMKIHVCKNIGISGLKVHWVKSTTGKKMYKCRRFIAIMGSFNRTLEELEKISPFDPDAQENYVEVKGETKEAALMDMEQEESNMCDAIWAI
jgi:hypothetical protein